jgi:hypothetical protein
MWCGLTIQHFPRKIPLRMPRLLKKQLLIVAALMALAAQSAGTLHELFVSHTRCPEHGELVDVPRSALSLSANLSNEIALSTALPNETHGHEHCALAVLQRQRLTGPLLAVAPATTIAAQANQRAPIAVVLPSARRWRLAPKHSPPLV